MAELSNRYSHLDIQTKEKIEEWIKKLQNFRCLVGAHEPEEHDLLLSNINSLIKEMKEEIE